MAAEKAYYQHHERTTNATLEADLQVREIGIDPENKYLVGNSEVLGLKLRAPTNKSTVVDFSLATVTMLAAAISGNATIGGTLGVTGAVTLSATLGVVGVATFTAAPVFSSVTASQILSVNGSKALTSTAVTGTGNVVLSASPTLTGTVSAANITLSGVLTALQVRLTNTGILVIEDSGGTPKSLVVSDASMNISFGGGINSLTFFANSSSVTAGSYTSAGAWTLGPAASTNTNLVVNGAATISNTLGVTGLITATAGLTSGGDLVISRSTTGTVSVTIGNTNNANTAAHAQLLLTVGGTSAGDPYIRFNISGSTDWCVGTKNSPSDNFTISRAAALGTSDALTIDSTLSVTLPGGDLLVSRSASAASVIVGVANTNNASSTANARLSALVGGSSAGDPLILLTISSVTDWSIGIDNDDSDKLKFGKASTVGTLTALTIDTSLNITTGGSLICGGGAGSYFRFPTGTSNPASPSGQGCMYENTGDGHLYRYNGSAWVIVV